MSFLWKSLHFLVRVFPLLFPFCCTLVLSTSKWSVLDLEYQYFRFLIYNKQQHGISIGMTKGSWWQWPCWVKNSPLQLSFPTINILRENVSLIQKTNPRPFLSIHIWLETAKLTVTHTWLETTKLGSGPVLRSSPCKQNNSLLLTVTQSVTY